MIMKKIKIKIKVTATANKTVLLQCNGSGYCNCAHD